jgi:hypothetical protein
MEFSTFGLACAQLASLDGCNYTRNFYVGEMLVAF